MAHAAKKAKAAFTSVTIPKYDPTDVNGDAPKTPKTPADEGIEFFESAPSQEPIRVYELRLDPDGGPNKDRSVECYSSPLHCETIVSEHRLTTHVVHAPTPGVHPVCPPCVS